jgi:hypothetical protein
MINLIGTMIKLTGSIKRKREKSSRRLKKITASKKTNTGLSV